MNTNTKAARIAGVLYVLVIIGGVFAEFFIRSNLIVAGDTAATIDNLRSNEALFRIGFISDLVAHTCYFLLAFVLYTLLKPVQHDIALLFLLIVVIAAPLLCLNMLNQFMALLILTEANYLSAFTAAQVDALVMLFLDLHKIWLSDRPDILWRLVTPARLRGLQIRLFSQISGCVVDGGGGGLSAGFLPGLSFAGR